MSGRNLSGLLRVFKTVKYAPLFFQEIASLEKPKPEIDADRRRLHINRTHGLNIRKQEGEVFWKELAKLELGKFEIHRGPGTANRFRCRDVDGLIRASKELVAAASREDMSSDLKPTNRASTDMTPGYYVFRLHTGQVLKLTQAEIKEAREILATV